MVCRDQCFIRVVRSERVRVAYSFERCWRTRFAASPLFFRCSRKEEEELQEMRTSSSCVLEGQTVGEQTLIKIRKNY